MILQPRSYSLSFRILISLFAVLAKLEIAFKPIARITRENEVMFLVSFTSVGADIASTRAVVGVLMME